MAQAKSHDAHSVLGSTDDAQTLELQRQVSAQGFDALSRRTTTRLAQRDPHSSQCMGYFNHQRDSHHV
jgi:hypothetical protein